MMSNLRSPKLKTLMIREEKPSFHLEASQKEKTILSLLNFNRACLRATKVLLFVPTNNNRKALNQRDPFKIRKKWALVLQRLRQQQTFLWNIAPHNSVNLTQAINTIVKTRVRIIINLFCQAIKIQKIWFQIKRFAHVASTLRPMNHLNVVVATT